MPYFWEPSTRTKLSFEHAAKKLGFDVIDFSPSHSSIEKGESLEDTIKTILSLKVDGLIIRHPETGISEKIINMLQKVFSSLMLETETMHIPHRVY